MQILATKLHLPPLRASIVTRPRLFALLTTGIQEQRKLTLVSAPAGYGKTLLVSEWLHTLNVQGGGLKGKAAWLSLDDADNDLARFIRHWLAAFQQGTSAVQPETLALLEGPQLPPVQTLLDQLINDLSALEAPLLMAMDDYHLIQNPRIHEAVEYFLEHQPPLVHLILITRADPPLPVARLRARGQLTEIRARTLRFTAEEARQFFDLSLDLALDDSILSALDQRTEGWAVGLRLASLALQHQPDPAAFVETFRGSHRYVLDYLAEEVIRQQGEPVRHFLTQTSILERFNADACRALTGREDSQALIQALEQANLFIMPLDDARRWYRYHHLFSDYLRSLLSQVEEAALYQKAAAWHEASELTEEAVRYALASGDSDFAAGVVERSLKKATTWSAGTLGLWISWLEALPQTVFHNRPELCLHASRVWYLSGRFDLAEAAIAQAERALESLPGSPETEEMRALAALYRGSIAAMRGEVQQAIEQTTFAQSRLPAGNHLAHARGYFSLGLAYEYSDQTGPAVENYLQSSSEAREAGVLFLAVHALCAAAQVQIRQLRLTLAGQTCQSAITLARGTRIAPLGLAWIILGGIALERSDLQTAARHLEEGIALARQGGLMDDVVIGLGYLTRLRLYQKDTQAAMDTINEVLGVLRAFGVPSFELLGAAHLARVQLLLEQKQEAQQWAARYQAVREAPLREVEELTLARVLLASENLDPIPGILHPLLEKANAASRALTSVEAMLLLALFHAARRDHPTALDWLSQALRLAAPEGCSRVFLDEGQPLLDLLPKARAAAPDFVDALLAQLQPAGPARPPAKPALSPFDALPEPLSEQEIRVLKLIIAGRSNQEIAEALVITVGTAKWHVHNVLQKLGVSNRPQAIARARELGL